MKSEIFQILVLKFLTLVLFQINALGQEVSLSYQLVNSLQLDEDYGNNIKRNNATNLAMIYQLNKIKRILGQDDTIRVFKTNETYSAKYMNQKINISKKIIKNDSLITLWGFRTTKDTIPFLYAKLVQNKNISQEIKTSNCEFRDNEQCITLKNYTNEIPNGEYKEVTMNGETVVKGNYVLKDSIYQDTIITFDYETYEELMEIKNREQTSHKCGEWIYVDKLGKINIKTKGIDCK